MRTLPENVESNAFVVTGFAVDSRERETAFGLQWASNLFDDVDSRNIDLFMSTNLAMDGWFPLGRYLMPQDTNSYAFTVSSNDVASAYRPIFVDSFDRMAFFRFGIDFDSDGDGLTDSHESFVSFTDPFNPDTDGDGFSDAQELAVGTNPLLYDTDGDGVGDGDEIAAGSNPHSADSDGDGLLDVAELGTMTALTEDNFMWFDMSGGTDLLASSSTADENTWTIALPQNAMINNVCHTNALVCMNGVIHLLCPTNSGGTRYSSYGYFGGLSNTQWSAMHVTVALFNADLYARTAEWGSKVLYGCVESGGRTFGVVEYRNVGLCSLRNADSNELLTCQMIIPADETNTVYVSYLCASGAFREIAVAIGVQCGRMRSWKSGEVYYNLSWPLTSEFPEDGLTIKYSIGTGTDPCDPDTDDDGLSDAEEVLGFRTDPLVADSDGDHLLDAEEIAIGTDPMSADSDGDGMPDGWEALNGLDPLANDATGDIDGDGLSNLRELALGTSPASVDTDGDGLLDGWEVANSLDPLSDAGDNGASADMDGDGLTNLQEQSCGGNPRSADTDGDGLSDAREVQLGTSLSLSDSDHDGLSDGMEVSLNLNPLQPDSDGDGMNDGWEYQHRNAGFNPAVDNATDGDPDNDIGADPDGDGLTNGQECEWGTDPRNADSDGDGVNDGTEIGQSSDPTDPSDGGQPNTRISVPFYFGDPSGSHSEKYRLEITPMSGIGETPASFSWLNERYGECEMKTAMLKAGWKYEVRLYHAGTNGSGSGYPDYDYQLDCASSSLPSRVVVEDPEALFGIDYTSDCFAGAGKVATITVFTVTDVAICKPDDSSWAELEESRVVLDDEDLRIKIEISPQVQSLARCRQAFGDSLTVKTAGTCPTGASVPIGDDVSLVNTFGKSEIRISKTRQHLISLGLLPSKDDDGVNEMSWVDVPEKTGQDLSDSTAFSAIGYAFRGKAIVASAPNLEASPPISQRSTSFLKAAGCEVVSVTYDNISSDKRQIMNQADYFYFSGHGNHYNNSIQGGFKPADAVNYWKKDLDVAIIAGCSVLDINDYNGNYDGTAEHTFSPGKAWEQTGPGVLLGYAYIAPGDAGGAPARIMNSWISKRDTLGDVNAWMKANADNNAWNACAIVKDQKFVFFTRKWFSRVVVEKQKGEW